VHLHTFKWINQPDAAISQVYYLSFKYSSTRFGHPHAHHARPRPTALLPPRSYGKPEAAAAVDRLLIMGMRMAETCWAVFKRQVLNLWNCCIWLVDSFECFYNFFIVTRTVCRVVFHSLNGFTQECSKIMKSTCIQLLPPMYEKILAHETMKYRNASNLCCGRRALK